jgi:ligand-binding sensor domain-containing protein/serine phosphatase RsbU (regulator of sigma subunit)
MSRSFFFTGTIIIVQLLICLSVHSQVYQFRNFGIEQGIPHRWVYTINQDRAGYLWIGTGTDLARFNGFRFETNPYRDSLPAGFIYSSYLDSRDRIWFGYDNGSVSVLENNKITVAENKGLRTRITAITEDHEGNILISSQQHGLLVVDAEGNITHYQDNFRQVSVTAMAFDGKDRLLIGTFDGLHIYSYTPGEEPQREGLVSGIPRVTVQTIKPYGTEGIFVGTRDSGLFHLLHKPGGQYTISRPGGGLGNAYVQSVYIDHRNDLWVSTWGQGIYKINHYLNNDKPVEIKSITTANGLVANHVYEVFQDREQNYWFATFDGLSMLADETFSFFPSFGEPFGKNIHALHSDKDYIWLGGESGLLRIARNSSENQTFFGTGRGLPFDKVTALVSCDEDNLWIGTEGTGIYKLAAGSPRAEQYFFSQNSIENVINDLKIDDGILTAATNGGVFIFNLKTGSTDHFSTNEGLTHNFIKSTYTDAGGNNWIATRGNRLTDIKNHNIINIGFEQEFIAITSDKKGSLWVATNRYGVINITSDSIIQITTNEGLHSNFCYSLIADPAGDIWVGHRLGVSRIDPDSYFVRTYGTENSIRGDFNENAVHLTADGILLFGTTEGLVTYDISKEKRQQFPPLLNITSLQISDQEYDPSGMVSLPYGVYKFRIEFIGLNYASPEKVRYQYKLEGYDLDWSDLSEQRFAYYSRLDDGNFSFLLRAGNAEGVFTEYPLSLAINIDQPIWKKWYFFLFVILTGSLIIYLIIKLRERNLRLEKERIERELEIRTREVVEQKAEIEHKNKDITDSINYAQRIQASILPPVSKIADNFSDSFVFYQPRDIVSGDFYWFDKVSENKFLIVCADSTGHGVPGAFMSMIGTTLIKDICMRDNIYSPSDVLATLDREITSTLNQNLDPKGKSTDGMDITVCEFDTKSHYMRFSSAMRPIMMFYKGELIYVRGSRSSIGGYITEQKDFEDQGFQLEPGDIVYLFSDGYPDQFGGPLGKKYKMARLKNLLTDICHKPMKEQHDHVKNDFKLWKSDYEQVDDVLFMGIKI